MMPQNTITEIPTFTRQNAFVLDEIKKASDDAFVFAPECVWEVYVINVMLCGRGLRTTHIHRPHTTCFQLQKYNNSFSLQDPY